MAHLQVAPSASRLPESRCKSRARHEVRFTPGIDEISGAVGRREAMLRVVPTDPGVLFPTPRSVGGLGAQEEGAPDSRPVRLLRAPRELRHVAQRAQTDMRSQLPIGFELIVVEELIGRALVW